MQVRILPPTEDTVRVMAAKARTTVPKLVNTLLREALAARRSATAKKEEEAVR